MKCDHRSKFSNLSKSFLLFNFQQCEDYFEQSKAYFEPLTSAWQRCWLQREYNFWLCLSPFSLSICTLFGYVLSASLHRLQVLQRLVDARLRWLRWLSNSHTWHASRETLNVYSLKYRTHQVGVRLWIALLVFESLLDRFSGARLCLFFCFH